MAGVSALAVALFAGSGAALAYNDIQTNIQRHDINDLLGEDRPTQETPIDPNAGRALNILVMGSDQREVDDPEAAVVGGMRSDTTMLVHVSAGRDRVDVVSIPRDTLVEIPSCTLPDGSTTASQSSAMFNSAFTMGGQTGDVGAAAACTIKTVEQLTGVFVDDFVVVDFSGFTTMVEALNGVPYYVAEPVNDPEAHLTLEAGCQLLDGQDALGLARARKSLGDGSDISRIGRQQELVAAIARDALSRNLLTDLPVLYRFLDAATSTLTTGAEIGQLPTMAGLASSLRGIGPEDISFATMPFVPAGARVLPSDDAEAMWQALAADQPIDATLDATGEAPPEAPSAAPTPETPTGEAPTTPTPEPTPTTPTCTRADV